MRDGTLLLSEQRLCSTVHLLTNFGNNSTRGPEQRSSFDGSIQCQAAGVETKDFAPCVAVTTAANVASVGISISQEFHRVEYSARTVEFQANIIQNPDDHSLSLDAQRQSTLLLADQAGQRAVITGVAAAAIAVTALLMPTYRDVENYAEAVLGSTSGSDNHYGYTNYDHYHRMVDSYFQRFTNPGPVNQAFDEARQKLQERAAQDSTVAGTGDGTNPDGNGSGPDGNGSSSDGNGSSSGGNGSGPGGNGSGPDGNRQPAGGPQPSPPTADGEGGHTGDADGNSPAPLAQ